MVDSPEGEALEDAAEDDPGHLEVGIGGGEGRARRDTEERLQDEAAAALGDGAMDGVAPAA